LDIETIRKYFLQKFQYIPPSPPMPFPKIYMKDPDVQIFYELEDITDLYDGCLLKLTGTTAEVEKSNKDVPSKKSPGTSKTNRNTSEKLTMIRSIRNDLFALRDEVSNQRQEISTYCQAFSTQINEAAARNSHTSPTTDADKDKRILNRRKLTEVKSEVAVLMESLTERVADLFEMVEQLRIDMVQRGAIPSASAIDYALSEFSSLNQLMESTSQELDRARPTWKQVWEYELKRVVGEQQFFEEAQGVFSDIEAKLEAVSTLSNQLSRVVTIAKTNPNAVVPRKGLSSQFWETIGGSHEEGFDGIRSVMEELSTMIHFEDPEERSTRRLRAAKRIERFRQWEREHRKDDFSWELKQFCGDEVSDSSPSTPGKKSPKLRKTGGVDRIERIREEKNKQMLALVLSPSASPTNAASRSN
jgi:hypothetical protein